MFSGFTKNREIDPLECNRIKKSVEFLPFISLFEPSSYISSTIFLPMPCYSCTRVLSCTLRIPVLNVRVGRGGIESERKGLKCTIKVSPLERGDFDEVSCPHADHFSIGSAGPVEKAGKKRIQGNPPLTGNRPGHHTVGHC
jgi:hypothetical protein